MLLSNRCNFIFSLLFNQERIESRYSPIQGDASHEKQKSFKERSKFPRVDNKITNEKKKLHKTSVRLISILVNINQILCQFWTEN